MPGLLILADARHQDFYVKFPAIHKMASKFKSLKVLIRTKHADRPPACNLRLKIWPSVVKLQAKKKKRKRKKYIHPRSEMSLSPSHQPNSTSFSMKNLKNLWGNGVTSFLSYLSGCGNLWWLVTIGLPC